MIDPAKLLSSASRIYGDQMDTLWGKTVPAPAERVTALEDGDRVGVNGLTFTALDTPGHAYHHHVYTLEDVAFTGDAAGIQIPGINFVDLPAPPPEFNMDLWEETISRLRSLPLQAIYPTHFGRLDDWQLQLAELTDLMKTAVEFIGARMNAGLERSEILAQYMEEHQRRASVAGMSREIYEQYEAANPHYMSVDGILRYWRKKHAAIGEAGK